MYEMPIKIWDKNPPVNTDGTKSPEIQAYPSRTDFSLDPLLQSIDSGIIGVNSEGCIDCFNHTMERLTGYSTEEAVGQPVYQILRFSDEKAAALFSSVMKIMLSGGDMQAPPLSCTLKSADDQQFVVEIQYLPHHSGSGVMLVVKDFTEKRNLEQRMLELGHLESIGLLSGGIAHDFNNLLIGILGNIGLAKSIPADQDALNRCLTDAENATLRAKHLTKQLLTLSKGGAPDKSLTVFGEDLMEAATFALHGANVQCEWQWSPDLWPVEADTGQIGQVMQNLIINAEQAMPRGGTITVTCENTQLHAVDDLPDGPYVKITVADQGTGISAGDIEHIFDPYFTTKENGSGLGLATSYAIIKRHDGVMFVESVPDTGTTFTILLPASNKPAPRTVKVEAEESPDTGTGKILIMDDETVIQDLVGRMLNNAGYEVDFAGDGDAAIEAYKDAVERQDPFDVVIMDLTIPGGMGGKDAIQELLIYDPNIKGIVSSGYPNDPVMIDYQSYGFKHSIPKPYKFKELHQTIQAVIRDELDIP